ncbi:MAG: hypothetical protein ACLQUY_06075 [Ktedonobacterales bacterium]
MPATSTLFHLLGALRRAIARVILYGLLFLIIGIALIEVLAYIVGRSSSGAYTPALITHITAAITGIVLGYAAVLTVIATEAIRAFIDAIRDVEKGVTSDVGGGAKILDRVVQYIEHKV